METNKQKRFDEIKGLIRRVEALIEIIVLSLVYYFIWRNLYNGRLFPTYYGDGKYMLMLVYAVIASITLYLCDGLMFGYMKLIDVCISQIISMLLVNIITYGQLCLISNRMISIWPILVLCAVDFFICFVCSWAFTALYHALYVPRNMVMIYGNENAVTMKFKMDMRSDKYRVNDIISIDVGMEAIRNEINSHDAVVINDVPAEQRNDILKHCYEHKIRTYVIPKITDIIVRGAQDITLFDTPLILVKGRGMTITQRVVKRTFDIILCGIAMIFALPIMACIAIAIKIEDHGPVFYRQVRVTRDGKKFEILKFRSMIVDAEKTGVSIPATDKDPRITKVGSFIRATRLDELPQLINIIKGDMSIVGPRPERVEHNEQYTREIPEFTYRLKVKGGLTGYAQIYGKYNTSAYDKLRLDLIYIENYSFLLDIRLILLTLRIMLKKESTEGFEVRENLEKQKNQLLESKGK